MVLVWSDADLRDKVVDCSAQLANLRQALQCRTTKLALVLVQRSRPGAAAAEDGGAVSAAESVTQLCTECELSSRAVFTLLVNGDELPHSVVKLENSLRDMAQNYYHSEIKNIRGHREMINKTTHLQSPSVR